MLNVSPLFTYIYLSVQDYLYQWYCIITFHTLTKDAWFQEKVWGLYWLAGCIKKQACAGPGGSMAFLPWFYSLFTSLLTKLCSKSRPQKWWKTRGSLVCVSKSLLCLSMSLVCVSMSLVCVSKTTVYSCKSTFTF